MRNWQHRPPESIGPLHCGLSGLWSLLPPCFKLWLTLHGSVLSVTGRPAPSLKLQLSKLHLDAAGVLHAACDSTSCMRGKRNMGGALTYMRGGRGEAEGCLISLSSHSR